MPRPQLRPATIKPVYWALPVESDASDEDEENFVFSELCLLTIVKKSELSPIVRLGSQFGVQEYVKRVEPLCRLTIRRSSRSTSTR